MDPLSEQMSRKEVENNAIATAPSLVENSDDYVKELQNLQLDVKHNHPSRPMLLKNSRYSLRSLRGSDDASTSQGNGNSRSDERIILKLSRKSRSNDSRP